MGSVRVVRASAGSGKTYSLTAEYIAVAISDPQRAFKTILAVTFTNKATAEMKERILEQLDTLTKEPDSGFGETIASITGYSFDEIGRRAADVLGAILSDYSSFAVSTIDKFFQRIVRSFFRELSLDVSYEVVIDQSASISQAIDSLLEKTITDFDLRAKLDKLVAVRLDEGKRVNIHRELTSLLLDAIGKGEDFTDNRNMAELEELLSNLVLISRERDDEIVALCREVMRFLSGNGLSVESFKNGSRSFATYFAKVSKQGELIPYTNAVAKLTQSVNPKDYCRASEPLSDDVISQMRIYCDTVVKLYDQSAELRETTKAIVDNFLRYSLLRNLFDELSLVNSSKGELPISSTTNLLRRVTEGGSVPFIFERLGSKYSTIFIDEFQDTSFKQWEGFLPLVAEVASQKEVGLSAMIIGDVKQAIYRWRGGDWKLLDRGVQASEDIGEVEEVTLDTSWRSEYNIVEFNNALFGQITNFGTSHIQNLVESVGTENDELSTYLSSGYKNFEQKVPQQKIDNPKGYVEICRDDDDKRVAWTVATIQELKERYKASRIAVLVRRKADGERVAMALSEAGIEFMSDELLKVGGSAAVGFVISTLRYLSSMCSVSRYAMTEYLGRDLSQEEDEILLGDMLKFSDTLTIVERVVSMFSLEDKELYYLQTLYNIVYNFTKDGDGFVDSFIMAWDEGLQDSAVALPEIDSAVKIITIHKAKGLEYDAVLLPFATWKIVPSAMNNYIWALADKEPYSSFGYYPVRCVKDLALSAFKEDYIEERVSLVVDNINLLYVALTRARAELYIGLNAEPSKGDVTNVGDFLHLALTNVLEAGSDHYGVKPSDNQDNKKIESKEADSMYIQKLKSYQTPKLKLL